MAYKTPVQRSQSNTIRFGPDQSFRATFAGATVDAFERLRTSSPYALLGLKQLYDSNPLFYDDAETAGSGTGTSFDADRASTTLSVSATTLGTRVKQSKIRGIYQPGKSFLFLGTCIGFTSVSGITKCIGYFDDNNGLFFRHKDGTAAVVRRTYVSGAAVDNVVVQSSWNVDRMDGTGPSGVTVDFDKSNIYVIDFEWLGVGRVRMGMNVDGKTYVCHEFNNANSLDAVYMSNPNLPIRYEISNDGTGAADTLETICAALVSEGGTEDVAKSTYISRDGTAQTLANQDLYTPLVSVRLKSGRESTSVNPINVDVFLTSTTNYEWRLFLNPLMSGTDAASWVSVTNSSLEYDISRDTTNTVSGGYVVAGGYGSSTNQSKIKVGGEIRNFLTLGTAIDGTQDEFVLAVANIDGNGGTAYGGITVGEYF